MIKNILTILILFVSLSTYGQTKQLQEIDSNLYKFTSYQDGKVFQSGYYLKSNDRYIIHGTWVDFNGTKAYFNNGEMQWIKLKGDRKYYKDELELYRLRNKVNKLQEMIVSNSM